MLLAALVVLVEFGTGIATRLIPENPPGIGIPYLALVDGILVFTLSLIGISPRGAGQRGGPDPGL